MRTYQATALLGMVLTLGACKGPFDAPNQNASTLNELVSGTPSKVAVATAAQGLFSGIRGANQALGLGILGREAYSLDVSNPQSTPQFYTTYNQLTAYWGAYTNNKQADIVIAAADKAVGVTAAEREGFKGFAKTMKALQLFYVIRNTDVGGAALDALGDPTDPPPAIVGKPQVYAQILTWLDEAQTHLLAAGSTLPLSMTTGFSDFGTPATFLKFNRAIRAKVNLTNAAYAAALTDLGGSFLDVTKPLSSGAYNTYSTLSGDALNGLFDPTARQRYAHGWLARDAKLQAGAAPGDTTKRDLRFLTKIYGLPAFSRYNFNINWAFQRYPTNTTPTPVLKNEELILIRAEANIQNSTTTGADPLDDINLVRTTSGNLPAISAATWALLSIPEKRDTLLYEKRYSLMYEGGDRWVDLRRYGLLGTLPADRKAGVGTVTVTDLIWPNLRIPVNECVPRGANQPAGCTAQPGIPGV
ncbi:MAG: RagB/SusD family nutrient uptake outer membrane protein [Gemmatimonadetes bacterium]|nr:RagB/SusD family nutrient uptake outer membrane protein [Gemmatimonadota bacterium]